MYVILESDYFLSAGNSRSGRQEPDTIVLSGVPSRWFAEPLVSSKPSLLVSHSIFSRLGNIRCVILLPCNSASAYLLYLVNLLSSILRSAKALTIC